MRIPDILRVGVIVNPRSGANRRKPVHTSRLSSRFKVPVIEARNPREVQEAVKKFSGSQVNVIVVSGGDGTVQAVHTALFTSRYCEYLPHMVVVGAGTTNMTAGDVGVSCGLYEVLEKITKPAGRLCMKSVTRDIIRLSIPGIGTFFGMFFTTAAVCDAMVYYHSRLHGMGFWGLPGIFLTFIKFLYAAVTGKNGPGNAGRHIKLKIDDATAVTENFMLFMVTTLQRLIFGIRPFSQKKNRGPLHFTALSVHPEKLWRELPMILSGKPSHRVIPENGYWLSDIKKMELEVQGSVALDGEMYEVSPDSGPVIIECAGSCPFLVW